MFAPLFLLSIGGYAVIAVIVIAVVLWFLLSDHSILQSLKDLLALLPSMPTRL